MAMIKGCSVIDLFCGAGGLTHGFVQEGFRVLAGIDSDKACEYAYVTNNNGAKFINQNVETLSGAQVRELYPRSHIKILVGCAPCQPFSSYNQKRQDHNQKWRLLQNFATLVEEAKPHIVSMENVPSLVNFKKGEIYRDFVDRLKKNGYSVTSFTVFCPDYGIPQNRTRLVLFASKFGSIQIVDSSHKPNEYVTVRDAISHLPSINAGDVCNSDLLHRASNLSELNLERIKQSIPGGTWKDWDQELISPCHRKSSGKSYDSVYGRMSWDQPSPTLTTECNGYGNGRFGHPEQHRAISMKEAALLQTFPDDYKFLAPNSKWHIETLARLIGNAVPVVLGRFIARSIRLHIGR